MADFEQFWKHITRKQDVVGKQIGLRPSVLLEKADPIHRNFEGSSSKVNAWWQALNSGETSAPLWLYLETTDFCSDSSAGAVVATVHYMDSQGDTSKAIVRSIRHEQEKGILQEAVMNGDPNTWEWTAFDTRWITQGMSIKAEMSTDHGKERSLAYVWTGNKALFAALHNPKHDANQPNRRFHHSSFNSGGLVLCAGMIAARQGQVTYLSNHSGHYLPDEKHLAKLVRHLNKRNLLDRQAVISLAEDPGQGFTVAQFLARP